MSKGCISKYIAPVLMRTTVYMYMKMKSLLLFNRVLQRTAISTNIKVRKYQSVYQYLSNSVISILHKSVHFLITHL